MNNYFVPICGTYLIEVPINAQCADEAEDLVHQKYDTGEYDFQKEHLSEVVFWSDLDKEVTSAPLSP